MGARLSQPRGPAGMTEASTPTRPAPAPTPARPFARRAWNSRTIVAPVTAFTMALLLFVYARTSIRAAKANAQRHRNADSGGEGLNLLNESRRRHGTEQKLEEGGLVRQLAGEVSREWSGRKGENAGSGGGGGADAARQGEKRGRSAEEEKLLRLMGKNG